MPPSLLPLSPEELEELRQRRRASQLKGYGEGPGMRAFQEMGDVGRGLFGAQPITPGGEGYRTGQALANMPAVGLAAVPGKVASALPEVTAGLGALGAAGVIKPKGGNWLAGSFSAEKTLGSLKRHQNPEQELAFIRSELEKPQKGEVYTQLMQRLPLAERSTALNKWIDTKLTKYVKNEMATPEDPVRALAERGTLHFEPQDVPRPMGFERESRTLRESREAGGYPTEGLGKSNLARDWESLADVSIQPDKAEVFLPIKSELERNPWLEKVSPDTPVYGMNLNADMSGLGFPHIIDELTNAMNPNSGLPASLRLTPQQLEKVTVPQAVERVAKINEWRAAQKAEADALRARNPGTFEHKTYETVPGTAEPNQKGLRWVELKKPESKMPEDFSTWSKQEQENYLSLPDLASKKQLEEALKYEGEVMGHCVGGYCPDVIEGRSRIYSLRDKKGEPHVTIEVTPRREDTDQLLTANQLPPEIRADYERRNVLDPLMRFDPKTFLPELGQFEDEIVQIKGKGNKAPKEEYLPFVQDFVRSGQWSTVGDLKNTGLRRIEDTTGVRYLTEKEFQDAKANAQKPGFARGGAVELKDGGRPPIESRRKASDLPGYGQGSTGALGDVVRGFMGEKPAEPTNPSELFRLAQALGAFPPVAGAVGTVKRPASALRALHELLMREAPEQAAAARQALNRALKTGEEHSVVGLTHSGGPGQVTSSGLRTQVKPNPQDLSRAINDPARSAILDFHTHPADVSGFRIAPSSDDLAFYRDYETGPRPRTVKTVIAAPPSNAGNRASTSYGFFKTDNPRAVYDPETFENARLEMQLAGKRGKFDKARMDPRFKEIFESGFEDLQTLLGDAAPLLLLERRAAQGLGRQDLNLGAQRLSPEAELQTFYDLIREPAQEFMKKKKLKAGGRVKIEKHPTLMADELLFKGHRK